VTDIRKDRIDGGSRDDRPSDGDGEGRAVATFFVRAQRRVDVSLHKEQAAVA
jgi:hypothetical protein